MEEIVLNQIRTCGPDLMIAREYDAPVSLLWKAWQDPVGISDWWGPRGFTTTTHEMDFREGGVWRFTMHGPDGVDYPNRVRYIRMVENELLDYDHDDDGKDEISFKVAIRFQELGDRTRMVFKLTFQSAQIREELAKWGAGEGLIDTTARLAEHLETLK